MRGEPQAPPASYRLGRAEQFTRIATYDIAKGTFDELTGIVEKGLLPLFAKEQGFVNYGLVDVGNQKAVSITIWETRDEAEKSAGISGHWVKENIADRVRLVTTSIGHLALFRGAPVAA